MEKTILHILVKKRNEKANEIQKILTEYGCMIKTRLGIHDGVAESCTNTGLIILELVGEKEKKEELAKKIHEIDGVASKLVTLLLE